MQDWKVVGRHRPPRIHVLSDVHLETGPTDFHQELAFLILIAAGDIGPRARAAVRRFLCQSLERWESVLNGLGPDHARENGDWSDGYAGTN